MAPPGMTRKRREASGYDRRKYADRHMGSGPQFRMPALAGKAYRMTYRQWRVLRLMYHVQTERTRRRMASDSAARRLPKYANTKELCRELSLTKDQVLYAIRALMLNGFAYETKPGERGGGHHRERGRWRVSHAGRDALKFGNKRPVLVALDRKALMWWCAPWDATDDQLTMGSLQRLKRRLADADDRIAEVTVRRRRRWVYTDFVTVKGMELPRRHRVDETTNAKMRVD